jgi:hypothetical protein
MENFFALVDSFLSLINDYPVVTLRIIVIMLVLVVRVMIALIRIPWRIGRINKSIKKLTQTLIRLHTGETPASIDTFIRQGETSKYKGQENPIYKKYFDEQARWEWAEQMEQFQHSDKPTKERRNERVRRNKAYRDKQQVDETPWDKKVVKKTTKK